MDGYMEPAVGGKAGWPAVTSARGVMESDGEGGEALAGLSPALRAWPACAGSASSSDSAAAWLVAARSAWVRASSSSRPARLDASSQAISREDCSTWRRLASAKAAWRRRAGGRYSACSGQMARWAMPCRWRCRHGRSEEHTSELQSPCNLVCRLLLEKKKTTSNSSAHTILLMVSMSDVLPVGDHEVLSICRLNVELDQPISAGLLPAICRLNTTLYAR